MSEGDQIARTDRPITVDRLRDDLLALGVGPGDLLLVHSSLAALGWVNGGPAAVIQALLEAVGPAGTLVMPAHSPDLTDPANWEAPPVPQAWHDTIRQTMPAYDARYTPTRGMGRVAELFRTWPGAVRSNHPSTSFAALGPLAPEITSQHELTAPLGMASPLGALYERDAKVLLLGVDFDKCTALHLAEQFVWPNRTLVHEGAPILVDGTRQWVAFEVPPLMDSEHFLPIGAAALRLGLVAAGPLGQGRAMLMDMRAVVDHAAAIWTPKRRSARV